MLKLVNVSKTYYQGSGEITALKNINLEIKTGELVAIVGSSGSGKSTLMNILGCLDKPASGKYFIGTKNVSKLSENDLSDLRNEKIGFIFQNFNLMPRLTACQNVELPLSYRRISKAERRKKAIAILKKVGLEERLKFKPSELSGGQKQRVAIARALVGESSFILADEPTGALDSKTSLQIMALLQELNHEGRTIIVITHDKEIANLCSRVITLKDGEII